MQLFLFLFPLQHMKRPALQNKQVGVLRMAFRARNVFGTFEKRAPDPYRLMWKPRRLSRMSKGVSKAREHFFSRSVSSVSKSMVCLSIPPSQFFV